MFYVFYLIRTSDIVQTLVKQTFMREEVFECTIYFNYENITVCTYESSLSKCSIIVLGMVNVNLQNLNMKIILMFIADKILKMFVCYS